MALKTTRTMTSVIDLGRMYLADKPDTTAEQLLDALEAGIQTVEQGLPRDTCRRCGQPIHQDLGGRWSHDDSEESRGCRAASYTSDDGWDEALGKTWTATPMGV